MSRTIARTMQENRKPLTIYKASAGSGKTFTLATEYIKLIVMNPLSYRNILAVTFTNKATEEMKTRILSQLYGLWKQLPDSQAYMNAVCDATGQSSGFVSERAGIALKNLLHNYSYFRVETIDTFFQGILRNLARELELNANLHIGLNDVQVEELAVDQLIEEMSLADAMLQWVLKYIMENISDDKGWNVMNQIKQFGRTIFRDEYKKVGKELAAQLQKPDFFDNYVLTMREIRDKAKERMQKIGSSFMDAIAEESLTIEDFAYGKAGVGGFFLKLCDGIFDESIIGKRVTDCLDSTEKWCKKSHPRRELIYNLADSRLDAMLRLAIDERPRQWKLYKSADLTLRHLNQLRLLSNIEKKVRELNESSNRFLLSDTQQLLHALIDGSDSPFIFERIGTQLEHVMIDEFQDTSTIQWQNFKILLSETMSREGSENLIVGDVKQSIYRWRSGDWRLLNDIQAQFPDAETMIAIKPLGTNYRSERNIVAFNNTFFQTAADIEYQSLADNHEAEQLKRAYHDVRQDVPEAREENGHVEIQLLPAEDYQEEVLQTIADSVEKLMARGVTTDKIAILVRTNAHIPLIAEFFATHMPHVSIVSDEAFRLDASLAVRLLMDVLHLLTHPTDNLAKANVAMTYQSHIIGNNPDSEELLVNVNDIDNLLPKEFTQHREELTSLPLYDLVERIYTIFQLNKLEGQSAYVCCFYDHLSDYLNDNINDIDMFVEEWNENICSKTIQANGLDGIRLISIHKSKGLEFDNVIIPFCDWQLEKSGNILWCQPEEQPFSELPLVPIDYSAKSMMGTIYEHDYLHEHLQNVVDNLNLLYVAFTRASKNLYVVGRRNARGSRSILIEQSLPIVCRQLPGAEISGVDNEDEPLLFSYGEMMVSESEQKKESTNVFLQKATDIHLSIETFESKVDFRQSNRSQDFINQEDDKTADERKYIQIGSVLHQVFSTIRTQADISQALRRLQLEGVIYSEDVSASQIADMLAKRFKNPKVAEWFSGKWTLFNECTILSQNVGKTEEHRPDRVMTDGKEWIVVDFKFGIPKEEHHAQVREYMALLHSMGHERITGYLWYVYSNHIEEVTPNF